MKVWWGKFGKFRNHTWFAKLKPSKFVLIIKNLLADLLLCQAFFHHMFEKHQFIKFCPTKLSLYTVCVYVCLHSWSRADISLVSVPVMQAMWCIMHRMRQSLSCLYNLASDILGTVNAMVNLNNRTPMVPIYVVTNWLGSYFEWQYSRTSIIWIPVCHFNC